MSRVLNKHMQARRCAVPIGRGPNWANPFRIGPDCNRPAPPFSAVENVSRRMTAAACRHVSSARAPLTEGGRLVTITGADFGPEIPAWRETFVRLQERGVTVRANLPDRDPVERIGQQENV